MSTPILEVHQLSKKFHIYQQQKTLLRLSKSVILGKNVTRELWALKDITFEVQEAEKIALIGRNGAGKTTLLRLISNIYKPTSGKILAKRIPTPLFSYGIGLIPDLPTIDNMTILGAYHGLSISEMKSKFDEILEYSGLAEFAYVPVKDLSSGQRQRLVFSVFVHSKNDFLTFDESFSMADLEFRKRPQEYFSKMMKSSKTMIISSHALDFLRKYCPRAIWLEHGEIKMIGQTDSVVNAYIDFCTNLPVQPASH